MFEIYDLRTSSEINPLGIDIVPDFSWKIKSDKRGWMQSAYKIEVARDADFTDIVWDSGKIASDKSVNVAYGGEIIPESRYYWRVNVWDKDNDICESESAWFETGLMGTCCSVWSGAEWIGSPRITQNPAGTDEYCISADFEVSECIGIAFSARDKDNYILAEADMCSKRLKIYDYCDNAWDGEGSQPTAEVLGEADGYSFIPKNGTNSIKISVSGRCLTVEINSERVIDKEEIMPAFYHFKPRKGSLFNWGLKQLRTKAAYEKIEVSAIIDGEMVTLQKSDFSNPESSAPLLGKLADGKLVVENEFNLVCAVPSVNVRRFFNAEKIVKSARVYSSARGFYDLYINGKKVNDDFYNPGFTDYRKRIQYQTYDVTEYLKSGQNVIGATVAKGYYSGHVGYSPSMIYGKQSSFIAKTVICYTDGTVDTVVTDESWQFTDKGAVLDADFMHGERYDARLKLDWNDALDKRWEKCGVYGWPEWAVPTNGVLENEPFELSAQRGMTAKIERVLTPVADVIEVPKGHFVYDLGQNMVGTVRLKLKGERGKSIKLRYGEMCYKSGEVYIRNLRSAYNTDVYVFGGGGVEEFVPTFAEHGFRYIEITGEGYTLMREELDSMIISVEGLVIANTNEMAGGFECSNELLNKLESNIEWGQRGNSLLVYTDCPQRNERMGWTGDAQVFAKTAAYNMNVRTFMDKWMIDMRDGQLMYNKDGAVPDTAPLGGDNRADGCAGWGDAAVIVPWQMYLVYGDVRILEENYDMMSKWIEYQSRQDRQNFGLRTVGRVEQTDKSDLASIPYIQVQQRRGDHLSFDVSTPYILSATAYAAHVAQIMSKVSEILGKNDDVKKYRERFENVKRAFNEAWVQDDGTLAYWGEMSGNTPQGKAPHALDGSIPYETYYSDKEGSIHHPSQTAYALALDFGLIPDDKIERAAECYKNAIERNGGKLSVGFLGISHLAPALTKAGLTDVAFSLLEQEENPGWLYSVKNGATTIWERWDSYIAETDTFGDVAMNSFNHYAYGAIGEWMFSAVLGINTSEEAGKTGYKHMILEPTAGGSLTYAKGHYDSVYGRILSEWRIDGEKMIYKCTVPPNTTATVKLPTQDVRQVCEKGGFDGAEQKGVQSGRAVYELVSGEYEFEFGI